MIPGQDAFLHGIKPQLRIIQTQGTAIQPGKGTWMSNDFSQSEKSRETCTFEVRTQNDLYDSLVCIVDILQGQFWGLSTKVPPSAFKNYQDDATSAPGGNGVLVDITNVNGEYIVTDTDIVFDKGYVHYILHNVLHFYYHGTVADTA